MREKVSASVKLWLMEEGRWKGMREDIRLNREGYQETLSIIDEQKNLKMLFEVVEITVLRWRKRGVEGGGRRESSRLLYHNEKLVGKIQR